MKYFSISPVPITYKPTSALNPISQSLNIAWSSLTNASVTLSGTTLSINFEESRPSYGNNQETLVFDFDGTIQQFQTPPTTLDNLIVRGVATLDVSLGTYVFNRTYNPPLTLNARLQSTQNGGNFAVPEPLTVLGVFVAAGMGTLFKRRLKG
jgi:hypothetical protein